MFKIKRKYLVKIKELKKIACDLESEKEKIELRYNKLASNNNLRVEMLKQSHEIEVESLNHSLKLVQKQKDLIREELKLYRTTKLKDLLNKNEELEGRLAEASISKTQISLQKAQAEIEILKTELELKNKLVKSLSELPDVKRMIDNIASMRIPAIDEMKEMFNMLDGTKTKDLLSEMKTLEETMDSLAKYIDYNRYH